METLIFRHSSNYSQNESGITIPVRLKAGKDAVEVPEVKLDTGASYCIFKKEYAEVLDLPFEEGVSLRIGLANGNSIQVFGHSLTISAMGMEFDSVVYFANDHELKRNVLGRNGWIQNIRLAIINYDGLLHASAYDDH